MNQQQANSFYFPDTLANWPWSRKINPHFEEVKLASDSWLKSFDALTPKSQDAFDRCNISLCTALFNPYASKAHFRTACDMMNSVFLMDEYTDVENAVTVREMADVINDALHNPHKPRPKGEVVLGEVARQFWALATETVNPSCQRRFVVSFTDWLESVYTQALDRDSNTCRDIESFLVVRRDNVGTQPTFALVAASIEFDVPDEVFDHPVIVELNRYLTDMIIVDNDIMSYNRENATGDKSHNLLTVVMREKNLDIGKAVTWAADYSKELQENFLHELPGKPSWGPDIDRQLDNYFDKIAHVVRGHYCWGFESERYLGKKGAEIEKTRIVPVLARVAIDPTLHGKDIAVVQLEL